MGNLWYCPVAAKGVSNIWLNFMNSPQAVDLKDLKKVPKVEAGEELGKFLLGSTVVLIVEVPQDFKFENLEGKHVRYGQKIGELKK